MQNGTTSTSFCTCINHRSRMGSDGDHLSATHIINYIVQWRLLWLEVASSRGEATRQANHHHHGHRACSLGSPSADTPAAWPRCHGRLWWAGLSVMVLRTVRGSGSSITWGSAGPELLSSCPTLCLSSPKVWVSGLGLGSAPGAKSPTPSKPQDPHQ